MRTSWKLGLSTVAWLPSPRARPRTKVVLPAPRGPSSSRRSPRLRRWARFSAAASVASGECVSRSAEVVVAALALLAVDQDPAAGGEGPDHGQLGPGLARPGADELHLLAACESLLQARPGRDRDLCRLDARSHPGD